MNITQVSVQTIPACLIDIKLLQAFFYVNNLCEDKNRKREMLEGVFVSRGKLHHISPLILRGGGKKGEEKKKWPLLSWAADDVISLHTDSSVSK